MEREYIENKVITFIQEIIDDETVEISEEIGLMEDLDLSSLDIMTIIADIEQEFSIVLSEADIRKIVSVGDLIDRLYSAVG